LSLPFWTIKSNHSQTHPTIAYPKSKLSVVAKEADAMIGNTRHFEMGFRFYRKNIHWSSTLFRKPTETHVRCSEGETVATNDVYKYGVI
jgi:hypothetical protein